jgi:Na+/melibiose symporter-like transporter
MFDLANTEIAFVTVMCLFYRVAKNIANAFVNYFITRPSHHPVYAPEHTDYALTVTLPSSQDSRRLATPF